jgi:hypothetical protein
MPTPTKRQIMKAKDNCRANRSASFCKGKIQIPPSTKCFRPSSYAAAHRLIHCHRLCGGTWSVQPILQLCKRCILALGTPCMVNLDGIPKAQDTQQSRAVLASTLLLKCLIEGYITEAADGYSLLGRGSTTVGPFLELQNRPKVGVNWFRTLHQWFYLSVEIVVCHRVCRLVKN